MKQAVFEYKCRRCGEINQNPFTAEENAEMILIYASMEMRHPTIGGIPVTLRNVHRCKDGGKGMSDLIGYSITGEL